MRKIKRLTKIFGKRQEGVIVPLVLILLFLGIIIITPVLAFNATTLKATSYDEQRMTLLYAADAGVKDAIWTLKNNSGSSYIPISENTAGPLYTSNTPGTVDNSYVQIFAKTLGSSVKTYGIFSTAEKDGNYLGVESYVTEMPLLFAHAVTSRGSITVKSGALIDGDIMGPVDNKGTIIGEMEDWDDVNNIWPDSTVLYEFYIAQIPGYDPGPPIILPDDDFSGNIDISGTSSSPTIISAGYSDGDLLLASSSNDNYAKLEGTLFINGTLDMKNAKSFTIDLNGNTIYATGQIKLFSSCTIKGTGAIISDYSGNGDAIDFQPSIYAGSSDQFIFLLAVNDTTFLHPGNTFYGAIAGDVNVDLYNDVYLKHTTPNIPINYPPDAGFSDMDWFVKTWETYTRFRINNLSMPPALLGIPYNASGVTLCASGGAPFPANPFYYNWQLIGSLPDGLSLNGNKIEGTPTTADPDLPYYFTIQATDNLGNVATKDFSITVYENLIPTINNINPSSMQKDSPEFTLNVNGTNFLQGAKIFFDTTELYPTTFLTSTQVTATVPAGLLTTTGIYPITVMNPGGGVSNAIDFEVYDEVTIQKDPSSNEANTGGFTYTGSGSLWQAVSDSSDSSYITGFSDAAGHATFGFTQFNVPSGANIVKVTIYYLAKSNANQVNNDCYGTIKVGGNHFNGIPVFYEIPKNTAPSPVLFNYSWTNNPKTGSAWTAAEINGTDINNSLEAFGVGGKFKPDVNFYKVYLIVTYRD